MSWPFVLKNLCFIALLAAPFTLSDPSAVKLTFALDSQTWVLDFERSWIAVIAFFWLAWLCTLILKILLRWLFGLETPEVSLVHTLIDMDGDNQARLQKRFIPRNLHKYPWLSMLNLKNKEKASDPEFQEAIEPVKTFTRLSHWYLQQQAKRYLSQKQNDRALEILKNLFDSQDRTPWTLEHLFYGALREREADLAQKVLQAIKKKNKHRDVSNLEGELLFQKAKEWAGSLKKKIWLLEKALILLPKKVEIFYELVQLYTEEGNKERAKQILRSGWQTCPDVCLVRLFCNLYEKETKTERFEAAKQMVDARSDPLSLLIIAFCALQADLKPFVLECAEKLKEQDYTSWTFYLESQIEIRKIQRHDQALFLSYQCIYTLDPVLRSFVQTFTHDTFVTHMDRGNVNTSS